MELGLKQVQLWGATHTAHWTAFAADFEVKDSTPAFTGSAFIENASFNDESRMEIVGFYPELYLSVLALHQNPLTDRKVSLTTV